jgi:hypothetical protein
MRLCGRIVVDIATNVVDVITLGTKCVVFLFRLSHKSCRKRVWGMYSCAGSFYILGLRAIFQGCISEAVFQKLDKSGIQAE